MHLPLALPLLLSLSLPLLTTAQCTTTTTQPSSNPPSYPNPSTTALIHALTHIAPRSAREPCTDDTAAHATGECRSARQAAPPIQASFERYGISSAAERAALVSLMAMESGEFVYARNHFPAPGVEGKGTRNMQSPTYNTLYAKSIPALSDPLGKIDPDDVGAILDLLLSNDEYDFGSAAWFLTSQCTPEVRKGLQSGSKEGWEGYLTGCVGTTVTEVREGYWRKAMEVFK
ncbi:hypothetical protein FQN53_001656 [Emmonsiellopsis sp. PD_33]|nr:hypothetical protein FQN53_001656 [Emmonsiellopsis sp. PD_33]